MSRVQNRQRRVRLSPEDRQGLERAASVALEELGVAERPVAVVLVSDRAMRRLNKQFRGKDQPTNVLSFPEDEEDLGPAFPLGDVGEPAGPGGALEPAALGDVILSVETARREAWAALGGEVKAGGGRDLRLFDRLVTLLIHGVLHLVGFDHQDDAQEDEMELRALDIRRAVDATFRQS